MIHPRSFRVLFVLFALGRADAGHAEDYCVSTPAQLTAAVAAANQSSAASTIRVVAGTYGFSPATNAGALQVSGPSSLELIGGHAPGCNPAQATANAGPTILYVGNQRPLLTIELAAGSSNDVTLEALTFAQAETQALDRGACVDVTGGSGATGTVRISNTWFHSCRSPGPGSALQVWVRGNLVEVKSSVFTNNHSGTGAIAVTAGETSQVQLANLTVVDNLVNVNTANNGGIQVGSSGDMQLRMFNNVFWRNGTPNSTDVQFNGVVEGIASNNLIGRRNALPPGMVEVGTLSVDPGFVGAGNFALLATSPLRNSGVNADLSLFTVDGKPRLQGHRVDRGAYEFSELFTAGFED